ncbi:SagB/ThcOx family dehydrogenase [Streptococcus suis]|nr:SagB/ThcOx family dehydrogenase [Streptococcus suis]
MRRSSRNFTSSSIAMRDFSFILNHSLGISRKDDTGLYFTYPNSGGIQSIIPIVLVSNVEGVDQGVYYYDAKDFDLYRISDFTNIDYEKVTSSDAIAYQSAFSVHLFAVGNQKCYKYQDRGYRFLLLECGHIMQSIHLCSTSLGLGCVMSGGGYDSPVLESLSLLIRENDMMVLYECFLGSI